MEEHVLSMYKALGSVPTHPITPALQKKKKEKPDQISLGNFLYFSKEGYGGQGQDFMYFGGEGWMDKFALFCVLYICYWALWAFYYFM